MRFFRRYLIVLVLLLLIAGSIWITVSTERSLHQADQQKNTVDAYFKSARYKQFNSQGQLVLTMQAPYTTLNKKDKQLNANSPRICAYNHDGSHWLITAKHLTTNTDTQVTVLRGNVVIFKRASDKDPSLNLKTDHLTLYPHDKAVTDAPVTLLQGDGWQVHGTGCIINLKTNTAQVLSHTDTLIIPHQQPAKEDQQHASHTDTAH
jgi:LPS export ABC transporter protein LptC